MKRPHATADLLAPLNGCATRFQDSSTFACIRAQRPSTTIRPKCSFAPQRLDNRLNAVASNHGFLAIARSHKIEQSFDRQSQAGVDAVQPDLAFVQALRGSSLSPSDRSALEAEHLFLLALRGTIELTPAERQTLTPDHIFILAMGGAMTLTAEDKAALPVDHLFMLALRGVAHLTPEDKRRLPSDDLTHLQMRGIA